MPRAIITGVTLTIVIYLFVNAGFLCALSVEEIKSSSLIAETFAFELAGTIVEGVVVGESAKGIWNAALAGAKGIYEEVDAGRAIGSSRFTTCSNGKLSLSHSSTALYVCKYDPAQELLTSLTETRTTWESPHTSADEAP